MSIIIPLIYFYFFFCCGCSELQLYTFLYDDDDDDGNSIQISISTKYVCEIKDRTKLLIMLTKEKRNGKFESPLFKVN
jgi:hypothetical protein